MTYRVKITKRAQKQLSKMEPKVAKLIVSFIDQELEGCENPRAIPNGKDLKGTPGGWRWRVGNYRILGVIWDDEVVIEVFRVGHRKDVYKNI